MAPSTSIRSLATLAYERRRRAVREPELPCGDADDGKGVPREKLVGSYAGATGYPQFLPSVYLRDARDADGDGLPTSGPASPMGPHPSPAISSARAGARATPWGFAVSVPTGFDRIAVKGKTDAPRCPLRVRPAQQVAEYGGVARARGRAGERHVARTIA